MSNDSETIKKDIDKYCHVCDAKPGDPCQDLDGNDNPTGEMMPNAFHAGRVFGPGPIVVQHTGEYNADGGGIFSLIENEPLS